MISLIALCIIAQSSPVEPPAEAQSIRVVDGEVRTRSGQQSVGPGVYLNDAAASYVLEHIKSVDARNKDLSNRLSESARLNSELSESQGLPPLAVVGIVILSVGAGCAAGFGMAKLANK